MNRCLAVLLAALSATVAMTLSGTSSAHAQSANWVDCTITEVGRPMAESGLGDRVSLGCAAPFTTDSGQQISYYSLPVNHPDANHFLQLSTAAFLSGHKLRMLVAEVESRSVSDPALQGCDPVNCRAPLYFVLIP